VNCGVVQTGAIADASSLPENEIAAKSSHPSRMQLLPFWLYGSLAVKPRDLILSFALIAVTGQASLLACQEQAFPTPPTAEGKPTATRSGSSEPRELPAEGLQFIRSIALLLLPPKFEDEDGWGRGTRIQSGLNVDLENGRMRTSRRWKSVNHGSWRQGSGELVDPETTFTLKAAILPASGDRTHRYEVHVSTRLSVTGRQQQWNYGVKLWSLSADAIADVSLHVILDVTSEVVTTDQGVRLRFQPNVTHAAASLDGFSLRRVSHAKGAAVREFGEWLEGLIRMRVKRENKDLATRINQAMRKKAEQLEIPIDIGGWFGLRRDGAKESESDAVPKPVPGESFPDNSASESQAGQSDPGL